VKNKRVGRNQEREEESEQIEKELEGRGERHPPVAGKSPQSPQGQPREENTRKGLRSLSMISSGYIIPLCCDL
jgi:hypothetical protein